MASIQIITNSDNQRVENSFREFMKQSDEIWIASAFFSYAELIEDVISKKIRLQILISLQYPTEPKLLRSLLNNSKLKINLRFYDSFFHSKIYIFFKKKSPIACLVGSSNFTTGGMNNNIETNIVLKDKQDLLNIVEHYKIIYSSAGLLSPTDIDTYQNHYNKFSRLGNELLKSKEKYERKLVRPRLLRSKIKIVQEAKDYFSFWTAVDQIKRIIAPISRKQWPEIRLYLVVDHFWHWIKAIDKGTLIKRYGLSETNMNKIIPKLFMHYIEWAYEELDGPTYLETEVLRKERFFKKLLAKKLVNRLTRKQAKLVYSSLHSGGMRSKRFRGDELFANENSIEKIRKSLNYLLWSEDDVVKRISALLNHPAYKLKNFGASNIQELLGWVHDELPIRNDKADDAIKMLGFNIT